MLFQRSTLHSVLLFVWVLYSSSENERVPTFTPTIFPSKTPTVQPTTSKPTLTPSVRPTRTPVTSWPTSQPTSQPSTNPTPSIRPPTPLPSSSPSSGPSSQPSMQPSGQPTSQPTFQPSGQPTSVPTSPTSMPTPIPSTTRKPTAKPSFKPSAKPTVSMRPTLKPTVQPSRLPTEAPISQPTRKPSIQPTQIPTAPTVIPTRRPTTTKPTTTYMPSNPTVKPTVSWPTSTPSRMPTSQPSSSPTRRPSAQPTTVPTVTHRPTGQPSCQPTSTPSEWPSSRPSASPSISQSPTKNPSSLPSGQPSSEPSGKPTDQPSTQPTSMPTMPTGQPSSVPSSMPSCQPSSSPSQMPSVQPSAQPSTQPTAMPSSPTGQPTTVPTLCPSSQPTTVPSVSPQPTGQPSSVPSGMPSSQPVASPTRLPTFTNFPTSRPTRVPRARPTSRPTWSEGDFTVRPTGSFATLDVTGRVRFSPDPTLNAESSGGGQEEALEQEDRYICQPVEIQLDIAFTRNLSVGAVFFISAPGITSGPCYSPENGEDKKSVYIPNNDYFEVSYKEGSYVDNYAGSSFTIETKHVMSSKMTKYHIVIDRQNVFRRSCSLNNTWEVQVQPAGKIKGISGFLDRTELFPKRCVNYYSAIHFTEPMVQFGTGINVSMHVGYSMLGNTQVTVTLPGFTNKRGAFAMNNMQPDETDHVGNGQDAVLGNITASTNFGWTGVYYEGSYAADYADSRIVLRSLGNQLASVPVWVYIPRTYNYLIPVYGAMVNDTKWTITTNDTLSYTARKSFDSSNGVGPGCSSHLKNCHSHGYCDYKLSKCVCDDGFGSKHDQQFTKNKNFALDCSSRACPVGPSIGSLIQYHNTTQNVTNMHPLMECSDNGVCNRQTGKCKCKLGFYGDACQKMRCHESCSNRGICKSMKRLAHSTEALPLSTRVVDYQRSNLTKMTDAAWDQDLGHMCVCDSSWPVGLQSGETQQAEFFGLFCQLRHCPSGDDPVTPADETDCEGKAMTTDRVDQYTVGRPGNKCHVDCSNRGKCDYSTGICSCFSGFGGPNCGQRAGQFVSRVVGATGDGV